MEQCEHEIYLVTVGIREKARSEALIEMAREEEDIASQQVAEPHVGKSKRISSKERVSMLEDKFECPKDNTGDVVGRLDVMDTRLDGLESMGDKIREDVNLDINEAIEGVDKKGDAFQVMLDALRKEMQAKIEKLEIELDVCKVALNDAARTWMFKENPSTGYAKPRNNHPRKDEKKPLKCYL
ncbi:hypothetical protein V6N11_084180 [Hibiscus sabdariffa]|uniref:Uncharacterized protein n=1 Tax=Hibiscus sabdariffa TaxID=183260 RepID=A0ABR2QS61_9ROSI